MDSLGVLVGAGIVVVLIALVIVVAAYILASLGTQKVLKKFQYPRPWMAWIPFANYYALADILQDKEGNTSILGQKVPAMLFNFWFVVPFALSYVPGVGSILYMVANIILYGTICTFIYSRIDNKPEKDVRVLGYLSGWISIIAIIKFLCIKEDTLLASQPEDKYPEQKKI